MENPIKMDDLGVPLFLETPIFRGYVSFREGGYFFYFAAEFLCCRYLREESWTYADGITQCLNAMIDVCNMFHL